MSTADSLPDAPPPAQRVARNTALRAAAEILGKLASLALAVVLFRELGEEAFAQFGFALVVSQVYWPIAGFGLDRLMLREIAADPSATARLVPKLNAYKLSVGLTCTAVGTLLVAAAKGWETVTLLSLIMGLTLVATLIGATAQNVFMARERTQDFFYAALPVKVFASVFGIAAVLLGGGLIAVGLTGLVATLMGIAIGWWILGRRYGQPPAVLDREPRSWLPLLRASGPWGLQEIFGQITFRFGYLVLFLTASETMSGQYRSGYQLMEATLFLPWSVATSVLPIVTRARRGERNGDEPALEEISRSAVELVLALLLPIALIMGLCAGPLLETVYNERALPAASYLPFLAAAAVIYGIGHIAGIVALAHLPGRHTVRLMAATATVSVIAVLALVPAMGARGAAIAALITETVLTALSIRLALRATGPQLLLGLFGTSLAAAAAMAAAVYPLRDQLVLSCLAGGAVYAGVLLLLEYRRQGTTWMLLRSLVPGLR